MFNIYKMYVVSSSEKGWNGQNYACNFLLFKYFLNNLLLTVFMQNMLSKLAKLLQWKMTHFCSLQLSCLNKCCFVSFQKIYQKRMKEWLLQLKQLLLKRFCSLNCLFHCCKLAWDLSLATCLGPINGNEDGIDKASPVHIISHVRHS